MESDQENNNSRYNSSLDRKHAYRKFLNKIEELQEGDDVGIKAVEKLTNIFKAVNKINDEHSITERVEHTDEILLDSIVLSSASGVLVNCIENLEIGASTYEPTELASKIINEIKDAETDELNWLKFLPDARKLVPELPNYSSLYGSFDPLKVPEAKQRKERIRKEAQAPAEQKKLERVLNLDKEEESVDDTVNFLFHVLKMEYEKANSEPIDYFDFTIDSSDFASTIENMFYTSFLIRDGKVSLDIDDQNVSTLTPLRKRDLKEFRHHGGVNKQIITSFNMHNWEELKNKKKGFVQIHKEMLKSKS